MAEGPFGKLPVEEATEPGRRTYLPICAVLGRSSSPTLAGLLLLQGGLAAGSSAVHRNSDPEDSDGRLDIVSVRSQAAESSLLLTIRTADPWRSDYIEYEPSLDDPITARLWWEMDTDLDGDSDLEGYFFWDTGKKKMFLELYSEDRDRLLAKKVDKRTVSVEIPLTYPESSPSAAREVASQSHHQV